MDQVTTLGARLPNAAVPKARRDVALRVWAPVPQRWAAEATATAAQHHLMGDIAYDT